MQDGSKKAILAAFLANAAIAVAKLVGFFLTGAASMLAEAVHSSADAGNQGLLFLGGARARKTATPEHPFGYGRERYFWSFVVALVLFTLGGLFALYEGIEKLRHPHEIESATVAFVILGLAIVVETVSFRTAIKESLHVKGKESWWQFIRRSKSPELPVVLLEDLGALLGLIFAVVGLGMAEITGSPRWDAVGSIAIGSLLVVIAIVLVIEMKGLLIGESASPAALSGIQQAMESTDRVHKVIHMRTQHIGPDELLVAAKLSFDPTLELPALAEAINDCEHRIRAAVPAARVIYIEPDIERAST
ncbi:MAG: Cation transporter [uncultured Acidimicrobiales bacterium]|uniref:Cation transporter n=1 Tax=uncultured Acidimicrobiales bacterium TaxID=310071 RepID=A0A6J4IEV1_9ACTN|nr:MAG: Cation transporter [uncultured Acidimicrobiales bacterium]